MLTSDYKGYKKVDYKELQDALNERYSKLNRPDIEIAMEAGLQSTVSVKNALNKETQVASDNLLTKIMKVLDFKGVVLWDSGERNYYIKN
jgi:hypothetical protein